MTSRAASRAVTAPRETASAPVAREKARLGSGGWEALARAVLDAPGAPLDEATRREMEARFGHDFARVRIHADAAASQSARALGADAYALGRHVVFDAERFAPATEAGRALLAHELTHVAQQAGAAEPRALSLAPAFSIHETEAATASQSRSVARPTPAPARIALSGGGNASPSGGHVTGAQVFLDPPTIVLFNSSGGPLAAPLQAVQIRPGRYSIRVSVQAKAAPASGKAIKWRTVIMEPASADDGKRMGPAHLSFSVGLGKIDPMTLFGAKAVVIPLLVYDKAGELPAVDPNAPALPMPDQDISHADPDAPPAGEMKVESEPKPDAGKPREINQASEIGHGESAEIDPEKLRVLPAYPSTLDGPDTGSSGGKNIFSMNLHYDESGGFAGQVFEAQNAVNYLWQMFEPGRATTTVSSIASAVDEFPRRNRAVDEDTENARQDQVRAIREGDAKAFAAGLLAEQLEPASRLVQNVGAVFNFVADATDNQSRQREVVWPDREGAFVLRVVAQPVDRPQDDGTILRHRPSIGTKTVVLKTPAHAVQDTYQQTEDAFAEAKKKGEDETLDPIERQLWSQRAAQLETLYRGSVKDYLDQKLLATEAAIRRATITGDQAQVAELTALRDSLQKQIKFAEMRAANFHGEIYRPNAFIVSELTGETYTLLLQMSYVEPKTPGGAFTAEISDVTTIGGRRYTGVGANPIEAARSAAYALAGGNDYGRGKILFKMPAQEPFDGRSFQLANTPRGDALARQRLHDLVTVVGTVASLAGPEFGLAAAALGGAVAADDMYVRYQQKGKFDWNDPDNINDMATVFVSLATLGGAGLQNIGKLKALRSGSGYVVQLGRAVSKAGELVGDVQMVVATEGMIEDFNRLKKEEAAQKIGPLEARRARAQILNSAIQLGAALALGHLAEEGHGAAPGHEPAPRGQERRGRGPRGEHENAPGRREPAARETGEGRRGAAPEHGGVIEPIGEHANAAPERATLAEGEAARPAARPEERASAEPRVGEAAAPRDEPAPLASNPSGETAPKAEVAKPGTVDELPYASVISNLKPGEDVHVYENVIRDQPHLEAAIVEDAKTGERFVIQGGLWEDRHGNLKLDAHGRPQHVVDFRLILSDPEFAGRHLDLVEHYHPGRDLTNRLASPADFDHVTHDMRNGTRPTDSVTSTIRYNDPVTGQPTTSTFEFRPGEKKPYAIEYKANDGSIQRRAFVDDPWLPGSDYARFVERFTGAPTDEVPASLADRERPTLRPGAMPADAPPPSSEPPTDRMGGARRPPAANEPPPLGANPVPPAHDAAAPATPAPSVVDPTSTPTGAVTPAPAVVDPASPPAGGAAPVAADAAAAALPPAADPATTTPAAGAPPGAPGGAATGPAKAPTPKAPADVAQALRAQYGSKLIAPGDSLANIIERARASDTRVDGRAAASELADIMRMLDGGSVNGVAVTGVEILPPTNLQRTPDLVLHLADGTVTRREIRTLTSAPRGKVTPAAGKGGIGVALARRTPADVDAGRIAGAIYAKAKVTPTRNSQLTEPLAGVPSGGAIAINVTKSPVAAGTVDAAIAAVAPRLGLHVERVDVTYLAPRATPADPLLRDTRTYVRQPNGTYQKVP